MTVAELFVNIGVKKEGQAYRALTRVETGLKNVTSSGFAAKAAIVGAVYALERLMSASAQQGLGLQQFANLTGISTDRLQRWQYAMRQSGVAASEVAASFTSVQQKMMDTLTGKGAPSGLGIIASKVGGLTSREQLEDTEYVMSKLREYAKTEKDFAFANSQLASLGLSPTMIQALRTNVTNLEAIRPSRLFGAGEISQLAKIDIAWSNLGDKIVKIIGHLNARHGLGLVNDLSKVVESVGHLGESLVVLAERFTVFEKMDRVFSNLASIIDFISHAGDTHAQNVATADQYRNAGFGNLDMIKRAMLNTDIKPGTSIDAGSILPHLAKPGEKDTKTNIVVSQNLNFHYDGKDTKVIEDSTKKAAMDAYWQMFGHAQ